MAYCTLVLGFFGVLSCFLNVLFHRRKVGTSGPSPAQDIFRQFASRGTILNRAQQHVRESRSEDHPIPSINYYMIQTAPAFDRHTALRRRKRYDMTPGGSFKAEPLKRGSTYPRSPRPLHTFGVRLKNTNCSERRTLSGIDRYRRIWISNLVGSDPDSHSRVLRPHPPAASRTKTKTTAGSASRT